MKKRHYVAMLAGMLCVLAGTANRAQQPRPVTSPGQNGDPARAKLNTASLTTQDGKTFRLVLTGDCMPELFVDGEKIDRYDMPLYEENIEKLEKEIEEKQQTAWSAARAARERLNAQVVAEIIEKKLAGSKDEVRSYYLTASELMINGKLQDPDTFGYFRNKYVKSEDIVHYYEKRTGSLVQKPITK